MLPKATNKAFRGASGEPAIITDVIAKNPDKWCFFEYLWRQGEKNRDLLGKGKTCVRGAIAYHCNNQRTTSGGG